DLHWFFDQWVFGEGYPIYQTSVAYEKTGLPVNAVVVINQTSSIATAPFFRMPIELRFSSSTHDTTILVDHLFTGQTFNIPLSFMPDTMYFDPHNWILDGVLSFDAVKEPLASNLNLTVSPNPLQRSAA